MKIIRQQFIWKNITIFKSIFTNIKDKNVTYSEVKPLREHLKHYHSI